MSVMAPSVLSENFYYDGKKIQRIAQGLLDPQGDRSFANVAWVYDWLGLESSPQLAAAIGYLASAFIIRLAWSAGETTPARAATLLSFGTLGVSAVFFSTYSKEVMLLPVSAMFVHFMRRGNHLGPALVAMLAYAAFFRSYWFLVFGMFMVGLALHRMTGPTRIWRRQFVAGQVYLLAFALACHFFLGVPADFARVSVNEARGLTPDSTTVIPQIFDSADTPFLAYLNIAVVLLFLLLPLPLIALGSLEHAVYAMAILAFWILVVRCLLFASRVSQKNVADRVNVGGLFLFSYLIVLSIFEPDYGSYLRHLTPILPIAVCMVAVSGGTAKNHLLAAQLGRERTASSEKLRAGERRAPCDA